MSVRSKGSVRMGPISLFALIILLSLAVLAVLATTTAQATFASADKHSKFTVDTYANEVAAQEFVASIEDQLSIIRDAGGTSSDALFALNGSLPEGAWIEEDTIRAEFRQESGRMLTITLTITDNANYRITQWQATTQWNTGNQGEALWLGGTDEG